MRLRAVPLGLLAAALLAGCLPEDGPPLAASVTDPIRPAEWRGGPEPLSGKLRSGISVYWRQLPAKAAPGETVQLVLRFDGVKAADAGTEVRAGAGARVASPKEPARWRLPAGVVSEVTVSVVVPAADSYLHVGTRQGGLESSRTLVIASSTGAPPAQEATRTGTSASGANGEPILRMDAKP